MATLIQFYADDQPIGSTFESDRVPDRGDLVELEGKRYEVKQMVFAQWESSKALMANVYLEPVDYDITKSFY
jgi:hypothetical protein